MKHGPERPALRLAVLLGLAGAWAAALAQVAAPKEPDAQAIIDALKPPTTRSLRNLVVRPAASAPTALPADAASAAAVAAPADAASAAAVAQAEAPPAAVAAPLPRIDLAIRFDFDSARLRPESTGLLASLVTALRSTELGASRFLIEGHTDAKGAATYNQRLSQLRADEVQRFLVERGVAADRLSSAGKGASEPANPADPLAAENRRVRVVKLE